MLGAATSEKNRRWESRLKGGRDRTGVFVCEEERPVFHIVCVLLWMSRDLNSTSMDKEQEMWICLWCVIYLPPWMRVKSIREVKKHVLPPSVFPWSDCYSSFLVVFLNQIILPSSVHVITQRKPEHMRSSLRLMVIRPRVCVYVCVGVCLRECVERAVFPRHIQGRMILIPKYEGGDYW